MSSWDGMIFNPTVFVENGVESWVLDSSGNPYVVNRRYKMGFDLTPKASAKANVVETTKPATRQFCVVF